MPPVETPSPLTPAQQAYSSVRRVLLEDNKDDAKLWDTTAQAAALLYRRLPEGMVPDELVEDALRDISDPLLQTLQGLVVSIKLKGDLQRLAPRKTELQAIAQKAVEDSQDELSAQLQQSFVLDEGRAKEITKAIAQFIDRRIAFSRPAADHSSNGHPGQNGTGVNGRGGR